MRAEQRQQASLRQRAALLLWQLYGSDIEPSEVLLLCLAAVWSAVLGLPFDTFATAQSWATMGNIAPERAWALAAALLTVAPIVAFWRDWIALRLVGLTLHVGFWLFVATTFFLANPIGLGGPVYTLFACSACWVCTRVAAAHRGAITHAFRRLRPGGTLWRVPLRG